MSVGNSVSNAEIELKDILLPLLRCLYCNNQDLAIIDDKESTGTIDFIWEKTIICTECNFRYPVTSDYIPIMWTSELKNIFEDMPRSDSVISANVEIYDKFSNEYLEVIRSSREIGVRIRNAVDEAGVSTSAGVNDRPLLHLDFGCGPGHVLSWLGEFGFRQVGLDVSLSNLRNARRTTGALVVCGDASRMPFADDSFNVVTESSVLHHIEDWRGAVSEACRVCNAGGGVVLDSEPTRESLSWGPLARAVFAARVPIYRLISYLTKSKYVFKRSSDLKLNLIAETHKQPGCGFSIEEIKQVFQDSNFDVRVIVSPTPKLASKARPGWKQVLLHLLSGHNPWNPQYGDFTVVARRRG